MAQYVTFDVMGRVVESTNPTEINGGWGPAGDDASGWVKTFQTYSVPNVLGWQYFYDDVNEKTGRVMFAKNTASSTVGGGGRDDTLDRSFDYDHLGRLIVSHTGYEARLHMNRQQGGDSTNPGPYSQAYGYDQWGNMTTRFGWGGWDAGYVNWSPTYTNKSDDDQPGDECGDAIRREW